MPRCDCGCHRNLIGRELEIKSKNLVQYRGPSPYRNLAVLRREMHDEVASLREEVLSNRTTIEELKKRLTEDEA